MAKVFLKDGTARRVRTVRLLLDGEVTREDLEFVGGDRLKRVLRDLKPESVMVYGPTKKAHQMVCGVCVDLGIGFTEFLLTPAEVQEVLNRRLVDRIVEGGRPTAVLRLPGLAYLTEINPLDKLVCIDMGASDDEWTSCK